MRDYIPSPKHWTEMFQQYSFFKVKDKYPIENIKINRTLLEYDNKVNMSDVLYMLMNFELNAWMPITINKDGFLLDGQHRLEVARQMGLQYIDVVIQNNLS